MAARGGGPRPPPDAQAAEPAPKVEKRFDLPPQAARHGINFPAWVGFDQAGRYLATAYDPGSTGGDRPRLTVWDAATAKVVLDQEVVRANGSEDRYFGLHAAFHP